MPDLKISQLPVAPFITDSDLVPIVQVGITKQIDRLSFLAGVGTVSSVSVVTNQGVSGSVATATTTPAITLTLGVLTGVTSFNGLVITPNIGVITTGTWSATVIAATVGGTGQTAYAVGDILYASTTTALSKLADVATGSVLISGGVGVAPSWSASPTLTTSLTVPLLIGGTAVGSGIVYKSTTGTGTTTGAGHTFTGGTNGATTIMTMNNNGRIGIGAAPATANLVTITATNSAPLGLKISLSGTPTSGTDTYGIRATNSLVNNVATNYGIRSEVTGSDTINIGTDNTVTGTGAASNYGEYITVSGDATAAQSNTGIKINILTGGVTNTGIDITVQGGSSVNHAINISAGTIKYSTGTPGVGKVLMDNGAGTGIAAWTTPAAGFSNPMTNVGDLIQGDTAGAPVRLAAVAAGSYLRSGGVNTASVWSTLILPNAITANYVVYGSATNTYGSSSSFQFNGTNVGIRGAATLGALDIIYGYDTNMSGLCIGADVSAVNLSTRTNATAKGGTMGTPHYTNAEEQVVVFTTVQTSSANFIDFGGGTSTHNSATIIRFLAGATNTTLTGTSKLQITSAGVAVGTHTATALLHIAAGTATAGTAPLKFISGTNLTTAEAGGMEYNGADLFFTKSGTTRSTVLCASAVTTEVVVSDTTLTVTHAGVTYKLLVKA